MRKFSVLFLTFSFLISSISYGRLRGYAYDEATYNIYDRNFVTKVDTTVTHLKNLRSFAVSPLDHNIYAYATTLYQIPGDWEWFNQNWLVKIDPITGLQVSTKINYAPNDLAFSPNGDLYGISSGTLVRINPGDASKTNVCSVYPYSTFTISPAGYGIGYNYNTEDFFKVNLTDGSAVFLGKIPDDNGFDDLEFDSDGQLYGWVYSRMFSLDLNNHTSTYNGMYTHGNVYQIAFVPNLVPEPATLSLLVLGGLCVMKRRKR